jgi:hypothetical protein
MASLSRLSGIARATLIGGLARCQADCSGGHIPKITRCKALIFAPGVDGPSIPEYHFPTAKQACPAGARSPAFFMIGRRFDDRFANTVGGTSADAGIKVSVTE